MISSVVMLSPACSSYRCVPLFPADAVFLGNGLMFGPMATGVFSVLVSFRINDEVIVEFKIRRPRFQAAAGRFRLPSVRTPVIAEIAAVSGLTR